MSPYLFILAMDKLSRLLRYQIQLGRIEGISFDRRSCALTNVMFADDLIIMGQAQILEAQRMMEVMDIFCQIFGQKLNSHKSRVWFSKAADPNLKAHLQAFLKAPTAGPTELWVPLVADKPDHFQILIDKVHNRLQL
jgi:Reverse transcriptase (RNA-dependent DNA polymerase)